MIPADQGFRWRLDQSGYTDVIPCLRVLGNEHVPTLKVKSRYLFWRSGGTHERHVATNTIMLVDIDVVAEPDRHLVAFGVLVNVAHAHLGDIT